MALFATQLQPWEEHQSPSPTEEVENPYELALARSRSSSKNGHGHKTETKPPSPINTLHRQLSGDPDAPPPAWKRRPSVNSNSSRSPSNGPPSASRRHPGLQMTYSAGTRQPLPDAGPLNESPNASGDFAELGLPQPAFRRNSKASSGRSSNRSSTHSLNGLTSEELWQLDQPDLSNPMRSSAETPLATARRNSRIGRAPSSQGYIPPEVIWPAATPEDTSPVLKSKSTTSVASAGKKRITIRKKSSRNQSFDTPPNDGVYLHGSTVSPNLSRPGSMILSSAHSSSTSVNSQGLPPVKVTPTAAMNRPPSTYYSRDFLSSLAPREGGYAIAATMGNGLGAHGTMSVDERRRSQYDPSVRRAPVSKSAGMGRWSLDGGEHYGTRPYGTPSAATTASNLSGPPITSPETSPPLEESVLPEGASPASPASNAVTVQPASQASERDSPSPTTGPTITIPVNPSPLSQQTHANDVPTPKSERGPPIPAPASAAQSAPTLASGTSTAAAGTPSLATKKSKKDLAKEAKADAQRQKLEAQRAEYKRKTEAKAAAAKAKADRKEAEAKAKQEAKRKEKEEKEKRKAEKLAKKTGKSSSFASLPLGGNKDKKDSIPPVPPIPAEHAAAAAASSTKAAAASSGSGPVPFPRTSSSPSAPSAPKSPGQTRQTAVSMPLDKSLPAPAPRPAAPVLKQQKSRMSLFGTLKKRFSSGPSSTQPDVRIRQASDAANVGSMPAKTPVTTPGPSSQATPAPAAAPPKTQVLAPSPPPGGAEAVPSRAQSPTVVVPASPPQPRSPGLTQTLSRDQSIKSGRSNSVSVRGPRPMPVGSTSPDRERERERERSNRSRPTSLITTPSTEAAPITPAAGFPFRNSLNPEIVTPSTTTETEADSSLFSHTAPGQSETSSPFTSVGSRKSSITGDDKVALALGPAVDAPERGNSATSKSSEETLQGRSQPAPLVM